MCLGNWQDTFAVNTFAALSGHVLHPYNDSELHYTPSTVVLQWNATGKSNSEKLKPLPADQDFNLVPNIVIRHLLVGGDGRDHLTGSGVLGFEVADQFLVAGDGGLISFDQALVG